MGRGGSGLTRGLLAWLVVVITLGAPSATRAETSRDDATEAPQRSLAFVEHTTAIAYQKTHPDEKLQGWRRRVPRTEVIRIRSSKDGATQRAIFYDSGSQEPRPLLVALHSWSASYLQNLDIPFAELAIANDWVFVHPDFRGPNLRPQATASELAIADVMDAVAEAKRRARVDESRIYAVGYSGGAMKALVLAARHPEVWAGVVAWGAIHDIVDWYHHAHDRSKEYRREIAASCGGPPRAGTAAEQECRRRSPATTLANAAGLTPILIAHGVADTTVPVSHALAAYNALADEPDRFSAADIEALARSRQVPPGLQPGEKDGEKAEAELAGGEHFASAQAPVRLVRRSAAATLVLYEGGHDMVYNAGFAWLATQRRANGTRSAAEAGSSPYRRPADR